MDGKPVVCASTLAWQTSALVLGQVLVEGKMGLVTSWTSPRPKNSDCHWYFASPGVGARSPVWLALLGARE